jgi:hypothetical protein
MFFTRTHTEEQKNKCAGQAWPEKKVFGLSGYGLLRRNRLYVTETMSSARHQPYPIIVGILHTK